MPLRRALGRTGVVAAVALTALAGCSSDGESEPTSAPSSASTAPTTPTTSVPPTSGATSAPAATPASSPPTEAPEATDATAVPGTETTIVIDESVPPPIEPPGTPPPQETTTTLDARTQAATELAGSLPDAERVGVPEEWSVRDLQAGGDESSIPPSELDPFRDVVGCPDGFVDLRRGGPWAERKFNGLDPSPEGVLIVRLQLIEETADDWAERRRQLGACAPVSVDAFAERAPATISLDSGERVPADRLGVFSSATADSPFPSQVVYVTAHADGVTATVSYFGLNEADEFDDPALQLLAKVLAATRG